MNYFFVALKKYAVFSGRARRSEYWYFTLFSTIISILCYLLDERVYNVYTLAVLVPTIAVGVRRMHDVGKSGWFIIVPFYNLVLACTDGNSGDNEYGADPKGRESFGAADYEKPFDPASEQ